MNAVCHKAADRGVVAIAIGGDAMRLFVPSARPMALMCGCLTMRSHMATNLALDQDMLDHAFRVSGEPTKKAAVSIVRLPSSSASSSGTPASTSSPNGNASVEPAGRHLGLVAGLSP